MAKCSAYPWHTCSVLVVWIDNMSSFYWWRFFIHLKLVIASAIPALNEWKTSSRITAHAVKYFARVFSFCGERLRRDWREDQSHHTYMRSPLTRHIRWMILSLVGPRRRYRSICHRSRPGSHISTHPSPACPSGILVDATDRDGQSTRGGYRSTYAELNLPNAPSIKRYRQRCWLDVEPTLELRNKQEALNQCCF